MICQHALWSSPTRPPTRRCPRTRGNCCSTIFVRAQSPGLAIRNALLNDTPKDVHQHDSSHASMWLWFQRTVLPSHKWSATNLVPPPQDLARCHALLGMLLQSVVVKLQPWI